MGQGRFVFTLAAASAVLAAFVPGVLDTPALATGVPVATAPIDRPAFAVDREYPARRTIREAAAEDIAPKALPAKEATPAPGGRQARVRIPVGCERLVSPLVKSAAASQLSRCLT